MARTLLCTALQSLATWPSIGSREDSKDGTTFPVTFPPVHPDSDFARSKWAPARDLSHDLEFSMAQTRRTMARKTYIPQNCISGDSSCLTMLAFHEQRANQRAWLFSHQEPLIFWWMDGESPLHLQPRSSGVHFEKHLGIREPGVDKGLMILL